MRGLYQGQSAAGGLGRRLAGIERPQAAGLLTPEAIEQMLKRELKRRAGEQLLESASKLAAVDLPPLTEAEIRAEIDAVRRARRS